jgi:hypothetical protein
MPSTDSLLEMRFLGASCCTSLFLHHLLFYCRADYSKLNGIREALGPSVPILAVTATATPIVQDHIMSSLGMVKEHTQQVSQQDTEPLTLPDSGAAPHEHPLQEALR